MAQKTRYFVKSEESTCFMDLSSCLYCVSGSLLTKSIESISDSEE